MLRVRSTPAVGRSVLLGLPSVLGVKASPAYYMLYVPLYFKEEGRALRTRPSSLRARPSSAADDGEQRLFGKMELYLLSQDLRPSVHRAC
ncbi:hypothetical protein DdX_19314 [Ditylenchus destructor]|uniref:Uncharacterized protein n=1 Tax=Ditylenchus destructor TaxID=166010 RepID=A0AAD4MJL5_9BILA|nr:hypothetical protein DdX_19314 [Ditylenchus destructor]